MALDFSAVDQVPTHMTQIDDLSDSLLMTLFQGDLVSSLHLLCILCSVTLAEATWNHLNVKR